MSPATPVPAIGSGLHYYIKHVVGGSLSWEATGGNKLPPIDDEASWLPNRRGNGDAPTGGPQLRSLPIYRATPVGRRASSKHAGENLYRHRPYFNVCTGGYSSALWDFGRWQDELDWMLFNGVNMPLVSANIAGGLGFDWIWYGCAGPRFCSSACIWTRFDGSCYFRLECFT